MKVVLKHLLYRAMFIGLEVTLLEANIHLVYIEVKRPDLGTAGCALIQGRVWGRIEIDQSVIPHASW